MQETVLEAMFLKKQILTLTFWLFQSDSLMIMSDLNNRKKII